MASMIETVARAVCIADGNEPEDWAANERLRGKCRAIARAAIEAIPLDQLIRDAYVRGVEWNEENPLDRDYRFKAAADYADKTISAALSEETR